MAEQRDGYRRHINPDGSEGGWVSNASEVAKTVYIGHEVEVDGESRIEGQAKLLDHVRVRSVVIQGNAVVKDRSSLSRCTVGGNAEIGGMTFITGGDDEVAVSGDTKIRNIWIQAGDGRRIHVRGGRWELPDESIKIEALSGPPDLIIGGQYSSETGRVNVDSVHGRTSPGDESPNRFPDEKELCGLIDFTPPRYLIEAREADRAKDKSFVKELVEKRDAPAKGKSKT